MLSCSSSTCAALTGRRRPSGTTILRRSMLRTFLMNAPLGMPAVYGLLCPPLHPFSLLIGVNTRQPKAFRPRVAGAEKLHKDSPGHCCGRTPAVDESRAKENPHQCVCKSGLPPYGSFQAPTLSFQIRFCFFWIQRRKMCGILADMPCGGDDLAVFDVEDVSHGRDPRPACRLRTPAPATPPISASISASTHANRRL